MPRYLNTWVTYEIDGQLRRAKIVDIEFHPKLSRYIGPIFHMKSSSGNLFKFTREELRKHGGK